MIKVIQPDESLKYTLIFSEVLDAPPETVFKAVNPVNNSFEGYLITLTSGAFIRIYPSGTIGVFDNKADYSAFAFNSYMYQKTLLNLTLVLE